MTKIEIVKWQVLVDHENNKRQFAELVGYDERGNEYRVQNQVYVHGQYFDVEPQIVCTDAPLKTGPWNDPSVRWVCESHPTKEQEHRLWPFFWRRCGGAGMPAR